MDTPPIQYTHTADGVMIAYYDVGQGPPLVRISSAGLGHLVAALESPARRDDLETLAGNRRIISLDGRGYGMSQRDDVDLSLDARVADIEAVVDALGFDQFDLWGIVHSCPVAVTYAVQHPQRISHLVLSGPYARGRDVYGPGTVIAAMRDLSQANFEFFLDTVARAAGASGPDEMTSTVAFLRQCTTAEEFSRMTRALEAIDITATLARVEAPTLVSGVAEGSVYPPKLSPEVASLIPNAQFTTGPARKGAYNDEILPMLFRFLDAATPTRPTSTSPQAPAAIQTVLFTDLESSTALTQRLGDAGAQEILDGHNTVVRQALADHDGREIKHTGDGIMAGFDSASAAVAASLQIQRDLAGGEVRVRIGLNAGEPIQQDDDLFGASVQLAARLCDRAEPGQIVVASVVKDLCLGKRFTFSDLGRAHLKGFDHPVPLFAVEPADIQAPGT